MKASVADCVQAFLPNL